MIGVNETYVIEPQPDEGPVRLSVQAEIHGDPVLLAKCDQDGLMLDRIYYTRRIMQFLRSTEFKDEYMSFVKFGRRTMP